MESSFLYSRTAAGEYINRRRAGRALGCGPGGTLPSAGPAGTRGPVGDIQAVTLSVIIILGPLSRARRLVISLTQPGSHSAAATVPDSDRTGP